MRFGRLPMRRIAPVVVQSWVNEAPAGSPYARSVVKYQALLHKIFARALVDQVVSSNPCAHTVLPKVVAKPKRVITAAQFEAILASIPARYRMLVLPAIETGMRWGELVPAVTLESTPELAV